jgi:hypothetical protein
MAEVNAQKSPDALTERDLNALIRKVKIKRETSKLMARFPPHLASVASRFHVRRPSKETIASQKGGPNGSAFDIFKNKVYLSVLVNSANEEPITKDLTLTCVHWNIFHYYITGSAGSETISVSVKYGDMSKKAFVNEYDDPGLEKGYYSHGEIGTVLEALLGDLGIGDSASAPSEVEMIEILLGDDTKKHLNFMTVEDCVPLHEVIEKKLEDQWSH